MTWTTVFAMDLTISNAYVDTAMTIKAMKLACQRLGNVYISSVFK